MFWRNFNIYHTFPMVINYLLFGKKKLDNQWEGFFFVLIFFLKTFWKEKKKFIFRLFSYLNEFSFDSSFSYFFLFIKFYFFGFQYYFNFNKYTIINWLIKIWWLYSINFAHAKKSCFSHFEDFFPIKFNYKTKIKNVLLYNPR